MNWDLTFERSCQLLTMLLKIHFVFKGICNLIPIRTAKAGNISWSVNFYSFSTRKKKQKRRNLEKELECNFVDAPYCVGWKANEAITLHQMPNCPIITKCHSDQCHSTAYSHYLRDPESQLH